MAKERMEWDGNSPGEMEQVRVRGKAPAESRDLGVPGGV